MRALTALLVGLARRPDMALAAAAVGVVALFVVPLPLPLVDLLMAVSLVGALLLLLAVVLSASPLELTSFPVLLLFGTALRLGLNVSTTRGILARGEAGAIVHAFGELVAGGDVVVGLVVFAVITLVQLLVVAKGAERVAEVAARFTLDAMPGRQMSIDAGLRSGLFDEREAERRRAALARESQLFGNMDGAMKFVKGDVLAGLCIVAVNGAGGLVLGLVRDGDTLSEVAARTIVLTVGDALAAQLPALIVTLAAAVLVTRVVDRDGDAVVGARASVGDARAGLGFAIHRELVGPTAALRGAGIGALALALAPGLPGWPFVVVALALAAIDATRGRALAATPMHLDAQPTAMRATSSSRARTEDERVQVHAPTSEVEPWSPDAIGGGGVPPLTLELGVEASHALGFSIARRVEQVELLAVLVPQLREALFLETGVVPPPLHVRTDVASLAPGVIVVRVHDVPVATACVELERALAVAAPEALRRLGVASTPTRHPLTGAEVASIAPADRALVEAGGVATWAPAGVVTLHLAAVLRRRAASFLGVEEVSARVATLEKTHPELVREVLPRRVSRVVLAGVLRRLVEENVSIRDLRTIFEALAEHGAPELDAATLTELVRPALSAQLAHAHAGVGRPLGVVLLDPVLEEVLEGAIPGVDVAATREMFTLEPELSRTVVDAIRDAVAPLAELGLRPALLTSSRLRLRLRRLIGAELAPIAVLAFDELPPELVVQPLATARL